MAWLVLVLGLAFTLWGWRDAALRLQEQADASFDDYAARVSNRIGERFEQYLDFLLTFQSLFHSSEHVTREEFRRHFDALQSRSRYRAVLAVQYSQLVEEREREAFERRVDGELHGLLPAGVHYRIYPAGGRAPYLPVIYNEPMRGNEVAMGFDSLASPLHKRTVEMARDEGRPMASGPVELMQGGRGLLIRVPVYAGGAVPSTLEGRRARYVGQVSGVFRAVNLTSSPA